MVVSCCFFGRDAVGRVVVEQVFVFWLGLTGLRLGWWVLQWWLLALALEKKLNIEASDVVVL